MPTRTLGIVAAAMLMTVVPADAGAADDRWQIGSASSVSSGKYGTDERTTVLHSPVTARRIFTDGEVMLVAPLTCISGSSNVTIIDGTPVPTDQQSRGTANTTGTGRRTPPAISATTTTIESRNDCGFGDLIVRSRYYVLDEAGWWPTIALRAHVKAPTASPSRGLGTGEFDEGVGVEVSRTLGAGLLVMVDGGFTHIGKPADSDYQDSWWWDVGLGRDLSPRVNLSVFFEHDRAIVPDQDDAMELLGALTVKLQDGWRLHIAGEAGLSDGAPAGGVTIGASRRF